LNMEFIATPDVDPGNLMLEMSLQSALQIRKIGHVCAFNE
jgi:hypothetical protein